MGFDLVFSYEHLKSALTVSLLSVWVLVGIFQYLNTYTKRSYFTLWTAAWLFYALFLTLQINLHGGRAGPFVSMCKQWAVATSAMFLLWGSVRFLKLQASERLIGLAFAFVLVWSYFVSFHFRDEFWAAGPAFALMGWASLITAWAFFNFRTNHNFVGAGLLAFGFLLWGLYLVSYPFLQLSPHLVSMGFFIGAVLQLFIAVSMIVLVLEEVRSSHDETLQELQTNKSETQFLRSKVLSTEELYRKLFDQASEGIVIAAASNLRVIDANQTAKRMLGLNNGEVSQSHLDAFCRMREAEPPTRPQTPEQWCEAICQRGQIDLVRRDGAIVPAEVSGSPVQFGGRPAFQFFFREMTERSRLEQQLRQSEKLSALGQMISGIAHELNNPMAVIKGYLELVLSKHELPAQTRADLERVAAESNRAAKLVQNFLTFARENPPKRQTVDVNALVKRVAELQGYEMKVSGTQLTLELDSALPLTIANEDQLQQVFVNLINNALHALLEKSGGRKLTITTRLVDKLIELKVRDNGPGIPPEILPHIFEPFYTTKPVGTGTGLGLSIAHSIMAEHRGRILYEQPPEGGAAFVLEIPVIKEEKPRQPEEPEPVMIGLQTQPSASADILVLDDEAGIADLLGEMLLFLGHKPVVCNHPNKALEHLSAKQFDLVLSDFRMPEMNGEQFFRAAIQKRPELARKIIFLTGDLVNEETQRFLKSTGNPHLPKPFQLASVEQVISDALAENGPPRTGEIKTAAH